jgi:oligopeptide transport system ATP-binding protein
LFLKLANCELIELKMGQDLLVEIKDLKKYFISRGGIFSKKTNTVHAVDGVSFYINKGETLGLAGESGCGKTTVGKAILRITEPNNGEVYFDGINILELKRKQLRKIRSKMLMVFQNPQSSLNPRMTVGNIIDRPLKIFTDDNVNVRRERILEILIKVDLDPKSIHKYPHEFSGGQVQRIGIARALVLSPKFVVLDEPTSALDVSVQAQILNLLLKLRADSDLAYLFISHNLVVLKHFCDRVAVMYLGKIVEVAPRKNLFESPKHPYTQGLIAAIPIPVPMPGRKRVILKGDVPSAFNPPRGCRFYTRCENRKNICTAIEPKLLEVEGEHFVACHLYNK